VRDGAVRTFLVAVQFLTRVPVPGGDQPTSRDTLARAVVFFPLVGACVGAITAAVMSVAALIWPAWLAALVALAVEARLTGAFHEDAVADFFDAFGGGFTRARVLEILKDSRIGSFGAVALALGLLLRSSAMAALPAGSARVAVIVAAAALGRQAILVAMALVPPVSDRASLARDVAARTGAGTVALGAALALPAVLGLALLQPLHFALALAIAAAATIWFLRVVVRTLGGITGDCLGCLCYLVQVIVLLVAAARLL
jgi:adenosylcobinamide-GDP ribazoletransferase